MSRRSHNHGMPDGPAHCQQWGLLVRGVEVVRCGHLEPLMPTSGSLTSAGISWEGMALESHCAPACMIPDHEHPTHFLQLQTVGPVKFELTTGGRTKIDTAVPGTIFLCPRGTKDRVRWLGDTNRIAVVFDHQRLTQSLDETTDRENFELQELWHVKDQHIATLMLALHADIQEGSPVGPLYGEALGNALAVYLARRYGVFPPKSLMAHGGMSKWRLQKVCDYIEANLDQEIRLSQLASVSGLSTHYFCELFRQSTGLTPSRYVLMRRIEHAKALLRDRRIAVIDIGGLAGFSNPSHFSKVFRRLTGTTPSDFRSAL